MRKLLSLIATVSACLALAPPAHAQAIYGNIVGTISDATGAAIPNAKITITDVAKGVNFTTTTNESGNYSQGHLVPGNYEVRVEASGF